MNENGPKYRGEAASPVEWAQQFEIFFPARPDLDHLIQR